MRRKFFLAVASAALVAGQSVGAQITVGTGDGGNVFPFENYGNGSVYEQLYFANNFGALPIVINSLAFEAYASAPASTYSGDTFTIYLSTTHTFGTDPNANLGADVSLFFQGVISGTANQTINGTSFAYDPGAGDLLMEVIVSGSGLGEGGFESDDSGVHTQRLFQSGGIGALTRDANGLVTTFGFSGGTIASPEPATLGLLGLGFAGLFGVKRRTNRAARQS